MKCEYCNRVFEKEAVEKTIRGKKHVFCSEYCYVLYHHRVPMFDMDARVGWSSKTVPDVPDFRELLDK